MKKLSLIKGTSEWGDESPPEHYGKDRRCDRGFKCKVFEQTFQFGNPEVGKVRPYTKPVDGVLLCEQCEMKRFRLKISHRKFVGWQPTRRRGTNGGGAPTPVPGLKAAREAKGWTQVYLAEVVGTQGTTINKIERGRNTSLRMAKRIAKALDVTVEQLRGGK